MFCIYASFIKMEVWTRTINEEAIDLYNTSQIHQVIQARRIIWLEFENHANKILFTEL